jgi:hypothetical protein
MSKRQALIDKLLEDEHTIGEAFDYMVSHGADWTKLVNARRMLLRLVNLLTDTHHADLLDKQAKLADLGYVYDILPAMYEES